MKICVCPADCTDLSARASGADAPLADAVAGILCGEWNSIRPSDHINGKN